MKICFKVQQEECVKIQWRDGAAKLSTALVVLSLVGAGTVWSTRPVGPDGRTREASAFFSSEAAVASPSAQSPTPEPTAQPTPSPTPSGQEVAQELMAHEPDEDRVPLFLRSNTSVEPERIPEPSLDDEGEPSLEVRRPPLPPSRAQLERVRERLAVQEGSAAPPSDAAGWRDATRPFVPGERPLNLPTASADEPPPPAGRVRLRVGSIPVEQRLEINELGVSSFSLRGRDFAPGPQKVRIVSSRGCIQFTLPSSADDIVYAIYDFELQSWRRLERVRAQGRENLSIPIQKCTEPTP